MLKHPYQNEKTRIKRRRLVRTIALTAVMVAVSFIGIHWPVIFKDTAGNPERIYSPPSPSASAAAKSLEKTAKPLRIKVSIAKQTLTVYDKDNIIIASFVCSTGLDGEETETPLGAFTIKERGEYFFNDTYQQGAYYWTQIYEGYLIHSVTFDKNGDIEVAEAAKLGTKASHGCVRLSIENAKWIYDNIPWGTEVVIV